MKSSHTTLDDSFDTNYDFIYENLFSTNHLYRIFAFFNRTSIQQLYSSLIVNPLYYAFIHLLSNQCNKINYGALIHVPTTDKNPVPIYDTPNKT